MLLAVLVYALTPLAAAVAVLTRPLLSREGSSAGRIQISHRLLLAHNVVGSLALGLWVLFLFFPADSTLGGSAVGILAVGLWWAATILGLLVLMHWLPARGRHAEPATVDGSGAGPWLSVLAHGGLLVSVLVFTYAYLTSAV